MALPGKDECPFKIGDKVRYIGNLIYGGSVVNNNTMIIDTIDSSGWCCGEIRGGGYHFSKFELASIDMYQIY